MKEFNYNELKEGNIVRYLQDSIRPSFNDAEFEWEFKTFKDKVVFKLYSINENIIASQAMLPIKLVVNDVIVETVKSETSYLNSDYRGNSHFENLYFSAVKESQSKGYQIIWGFTPAVKVWEKKLNFDVVKPNISEATISLSKYPSNSFLKKYVNNSAVLFVKITLYSMLRAFERRPQFQLSQKSLTVNSNFPAASILHEFQKKLSDKFKLKVYLDLTEQYVNWRITTNPLLKYQSCFFYDKAKLIGYVIFSIKDDRLSIADISFLDSEMGIHMLGHVINHHSNNITSVFYFGNDDSEYGRNVFNVFDNYKAQIVKSNWANTVIKDISQDNKYKNTLDPSAWYINGLWTEGFSI